MSADKRGRQTSDSVWHAGLTIHPAIRAAQLGCVGETRAPAVLCVVDVKSELAVERARKAWASRLHDSCLLVATSAPLLSLSAAVHLHRSRAIVFQVYPRSVSCLLPWCVSSNGATASQQCGNLDSPRVAHLCCVCADASMATVMSRWGSNEALDAHLAAFDLNSVATAKSKLQQHPPAPQASLAHQSVSTFNQQPLRPALPSYLQQSTNGGPSRSHNSWRPSVPARPETSPAAQPTGGGAPLASYLSTSSAQFSRPSFHAAPRAPPPASAFNPFNHPTTSNVAAPVSSAPHHVPLPFSHLTSSTQRPPAASVPVVSPSSASSSSLPPAFVPPIRPYNPTPSGPSTSLPGFGRPSKPAWLTANRCPSPTKVDGGSSTASSPQRAIGPPPGVNPGAWWRQFHIDKSERLEQQKQKRREDGRARRQLLGATRVSRQLQQESAFLDPQFTRYVNQSMEPTDDERQRLREEGGGWKRRVVERYAHMQCMPDPVSVIEHSERCERIVKWMQRLEELKQQRPTYADHVSDAKGGEKRKKVRKAGKAGSAKRPRNEKQEEKSLSEPAESAKELHAKAGNSDEEEDIPLRPLHSAAVPAQHLTSRCAQDDSKEVPADDRAVDAVLLSVNVADDEDEPLILDARSPPPSPPSRAASTRPPSLLWAAVPSVSALVDFPDFPSYEVGDCDPSALVTAQLQQLVLTSDAVEDVYLLTLEPPLSSLRPSRIRTRAIASTETVLPSVVMPLPKDRQTPLASSRSEPNTAPVSQSSTARLPTPASAQFAEPASVLSVPVAPPRPLLPTSRPLPDPRSFMQPCASVGSTHCPSHTSPPRPPPPSTSSAPTSATMTAPFGPHSPASSPAPVAVSTTSQSTRSPAAPCAGTVTVADRDTRKSLAAAKREQWLREHGGATRDTSDSPRPPHPTQLHTKSQMPQAQVVAHVPRTRSPVADVIDLASSSEDEETPLPLLHSRAATLPPFVAAAAPSPPPPAPSRLVSPALAVAPQRPSALSAAPPYPASSGGAVLSSGGRIVLNADVVMPAAASVTSSTKGNQPFAAFRAPSVVREKRRAERRTMAEQGRTDKQYGGNVSTEKENVQVNVCAQPMSSIYSQISQS